MQSPAPQLDLDHAEVAQDESKIETLLPPPSEIEPEVDDIERGGASDDYDSDQLFEGRAQGYADQFAGNLSDTDFVSPTSPYLGGPSASSGVKAHPRSFITKFNESVRGQNVYEIQGLYEQSYRHFKTEPWPSFDQIIPFISDEVFLMLYKELYYRDKYSKSTPTLENRIDSWNNYCNLFNFFLEGHPYHQKNELELPNQWLWDMIDEFIFQFQSCSLYCSKVDGQSHEANTIKSLGAWSPLSVLNYLHALVNKSSIIQYLDKIKRMEGGEEFEDFSTPSSLRILGYFSIIGLCRVHSLLGDYYLALKVLEPIDLNNKGFSTQIISCHITLYYYMGFAYLMMRRYVDAIKAFSSILTFINRSKQYISRLFQIDQINKKTEHLHSLLAIAVSLCPQRVEENIQPIIRDKLSKLQRGDEAFLKEFSMACPKSISPSSLYDDNSATQNPETLHRLWCFLGGSFQEQLRQQQYIPTLRSYLKLYTTIKISKLAQLMEIDEETLRTQLISFKHKTRNITWNGGPLLSGTWASSSEVDFYIDQDMIHISTNRVSRKNSEFFIKYIMKFEEILAELEAPHDTH